MNTRIQQPQYRFLKIGKWFRENKKKIIMAVSTAIGGAALGGFGAILGGLLGKWLTQDMKMAILDFELDYDDAKTLTNWVNGSFIPWYNSLAKRIDAAPYQRSNANTFLANVNYVQKHLAIMKKWTVERTLIAKDPNSFVRKESVNYAMAREVLVLDAIRILEQAIQDYLKEKGLTNLVKEVKTESIGMSTYLNGMSYTWSDPRAQVTYTVYKQPQSNQLGGGANIGTTETAVTTTTTQNSGTTQQATTQTASSAPQQSKPKEKKKGSIVPLALVTGLVLVAASGSKKSKKKVSNNSK